MTLFPIQNYFIFNDKIKPISEFTSSENDGGVYEVIRVKNGVPLFLENHLIRFFRSAEIANIPVFLSMQKISGFVKLLIEKNCVDEGNLLISLKLNLKIFSIPHKYPTSENYFRGVKCGILFIERENPNAKVFQTSVRKKANKQIGENDFYEVLLVDKSGVITEGSRSNVFFVKEDKIITPPGKSVLLGITRQKTLEIAENIGVNLFEKDILLDELSSFDAMFITGTSPKILPIKQVAEISFNPQNEILQSLIKQYNLLIDKYVKMYS